MYKIIKTSYKEEVNKDLKEVNKEEILGFETFTAAQDFMNANVTSILNAIKSHNRFVEAETNLKRDRVSIHDNQNIYHKYFDFYIQEYS
ncbi:hypothetical protein [Clostridium mediterraneense]|uniref:hypothetical protein n=1 Tax=Clostridium mediterraneense TaxID=1805472 RepID=UPI0008351DF5|nr:hypothetical protein [Clostridium mediterraneense]